MNFAEYKNLKPDENYVGKSNTAATGLLYIGIVKGISNNDVELEIIVPKSRKGQRITETYRALMVLERGPILT